MKRWIIWALAAAAVAIAIAVFVMRKRDADDAPEGLAPPDGSGGADSGTAAGYPAMPVQLSSTVKGVAAITKCMGNLRPNNPPDKWQGLAAANYRNSSGEFIAFVDWAYGTRATLITLRTYYNKHGRTTIRAVITAWAPSTENNTQAYMSAVSLRMQKGVDAALALSELPLLAAAIQQHETGIPDTLWNELRQFTANVNAWAKVF
jgi:hypothetical protein